MDQREGGKAANRSLVSAARYVRTRASAILRGRAEYINRPQAERDALCEWARDQGRELISNYCRRFYPIGAGAEHRVFHDKENGLAIKATHPNCFGWSVAYEGAQATPFEYLRRLVYQNWFFGDQIELVGVMTGDDHIEIVTSQPWITGSPVSPEATEDHILHYFAELRFLPSRCFPAGGGFYCREFDVVAADAHSRNVLIDEEGRILPIDIVMGRPGPNLLKLLKDEFPPESDLQERSESYGVVPSMYQI